MQTRIIIFIAAIVLLIACVLGIWAAGGQRQTTLPNSFCGESHIPELSELLNKSGSYSFSYIYAHSQRIAAVDDKGNRYFYIYSPSSELSMIVDDNNKPIWNSKCP
jgi:hypothetical protein